jgi:hypothetical protein
VLSADPRGQAHKRLLAHLVAYLCGFCRYSSRPGVQICWATSLGTFRSHRILAKQKVSPAVLHTNTREAWSSLTHPESSRRISLCIFVDLKTHICGADHVGNRVRHNKRRHGAPWLSDLVPFLLLEIQTCSA